MRRHPSPNRLAKARRLRAGFTLVELMIALTLLALVSALALPTYQAQVAKGRRADAHQALYALAQRMERHYLQRGSYVGATLGAAGLYPASSAGGYYALSITQQAPDSYRLRATPRGAQRGDGCASLELDQYGTHSVSGDARLPAAQCW